MVEIRTDWLQETAERRWNQLIADDLAKRKQSHKKRNWPRQLTIDEIRSINGARNLVELQNAVAAIEHGGNIPPSNDADTALKNKGVIPFFAQPEVKDFKQEVKELNYVPNYDAGEIFKEFIYKAKEKKDPNYVLQPNERLHSIDKEDNSLWVEVPEKQIINVVSFHPALKIENLSTFTRYLWRQQQAKSEWDLSVYRIGNNIIETYEQFKQNVLKTASTDFVKIERNKNDQSIHKITLTNLCSFVSRYLKDEPLSPNKRHLIELMKNLRIDLLAHKSFFWERIQKEVLTPYSAPTPAPYTTPEIQEWLQRTRDDIAFRYTPYLKSIVKPNGTEYYPMCPNITSYLADVEGIINDLEIILRDFYYKWFVNPKLAASRLITKYISNLTGQDSSEDKSFRQKSHSRSVQKEKDSIPDIPIKTSEADNIGAWGRTKSMMMKSQLKETLKDIMNQNQDKNDTNRKKIIQRGEEKTIAKDVDLDPRKLDWLERVVQMFLMGDKIPKTLNKHFFSLPIEVKPFDDDEDSNAWLKDYWNKN